MTVMVTLLRGAVRVYQWTLRPLIGPHCRFEPSCSEYALTALSRHGAARGSLLAGRRILRCNPWHPGGFDPVPDAPGGRHAACAHAGCAADAFTLFPGSQSGR